MSGEPASDPYLRKINSMINAPVREQLEAIANWHDSKHPSRMALGAVASSALNHVNTLEAQNHEALVRMMKYGLALERIVAYENAESWECKPLVAIAREALGFDANPSADKPGGEHG